MWATWKPGAPSWIPVRMARKPKAELQILLWKPTSRELGGPWDRISWVLAGLTGGWRWDSKLTPQWDSKLEGGIRNWSPGGIRNRGGWDSKLGLVGFETALASGTAYSGAWSSGLARCWRLGMEALSVGCPPGKRACQAPGRTEHVTSCLPYLLHPQRFTDPRWELAFIIVGSCSDMLWGTSHASLRANFCYSGILRGISVLQHRDICIVCFH